jgi:hypothetical protein
MDVLSYPINKYCFLIIESLMKSGSGYYIDELKLKSKWEMNGGLVGNRG